MAKTFTYLNDLSTALDYARFRLDDTDPQVSVDEQKAPSPFLWDETYLALIGKFGIQMGMVLAARAIAARIAKDITAFGESQGVRVTWANKDYYEKLANEIAKEPPFSLDGTDPYTGMAKTGLIKRGQEDAGNLLRYINTPPAFPLGTPNSDSDDDIDENYCGEFYI